MTFNRKTFQTRALTAVIFAAVMLVGLLWNQWTFLVLLSIIHSGCWWEYFNLLEKIYDNIYNRYTRIAFMVIGIAILVFFCSSTYRVNNFQINQNLPGPLSIIGFVLLGLGTFRTGNMSLKAFAAATAGLIYISLSWALMVNLYLSGAGELPPVIPFPDPAKEFSHQISKPWIIPLAIISAIWINDTMAYIVGSLIGKTPFSKISPKKTWEGTIGGIILGTAVTGLIFSNIAGNSGFVDTFKRQDWYFIAALAAVFGTLGDLLESKLKRMAGVKDSGNIMPGHGGFLDRFDSLLLAMPAGWLYVFFFMR